MTLTGIEQRLENLASPGDMQNHLRGLAALKYIGGKNFGGPVSTLTSFSEDLARFNAGGTREGRDRLYRFALAAGATDSDIVEVVIQLSVYYGFPAPLNAAGRAKNVLKGQGRPQPLYFPDGRNQMLHCIIDGGCGLKCEPGHVPFNIPATLRQLCDV